MTVGGNASSATGGPADGTRLQQLQALGMLCGFSAGAWLGAAEAPTKLVTAGVSPMVVSLLMVAGVFLARWSLPALVRGTAQIRADFHAAPHLVIWGVLAGCLWAVANTLTIFAIRDIGLSIAFPLWNLNSLLGILWGVTLFRELRGAGKLRWLGVTGGAAVMFAGATLLAVASSAQTTPSHALRGIVAALGAGVLWGTMYIPYRKAYLTGMNPLSFVAFFTIGELGMMSALAISYSGGAAGLAREIGHAKPALFWLMLGGFVWVIGDVFQQYAAKYVGISRGIPLSNTNQLWGLMWGILVFGEFHGQSGATLARVVAGSLLMAAGAGAIALASVSQGEHERWRKAAQREGVRYGVAEGYLRAGLEGREAESNSSGKKGRNWLDWVLVLGATAIFLWLASAAHAPQIAMNWTAAEVLCVAMLAFLLASAIALQKVTKFQ
ncbi:MAG TPA: GRP family sugar transporter [Candidatus Acidoferrum sp.]|nr:GRP family sugar transporter [Candidatus Acidoferrum sp.]